ncbi:hypothetical protein [Peribacillus cavernae]|uniref:hypothetical protein n=1 Tax=Peribacillus cavernae TaxID=1674310 RepID=UPI00163BE346|nr:hypothetical protein [Peribacillus cavernae]MDQ0219416.1 hypothetical protein [Peribacillus cavernae]
MEQLKVVENEREYYVVYANSEQDWVAKFEKSWPDAKEWAYHMVNVYNDRISD